MVLETKRSFTIVTSYIQRLSGVKELKLNFHFISFLLKHNFELDVIRRIGAGDEFMTISNLLSEARDWIEVALSVADLSLNFG